MQRKSERALRRGRALKRPNKPVSLSSNLSHLDSLPLESLKALVGRGSKRAAEWEGGSSHSGEDTAGCPVVDRGERQRGRPTNIPAPFSRQSVISQVPRDENLGQRAPDGCGTSSGAGGRKCRAEAQTAGRGVSCDSADASAERPPPTIRSHKSTEMRRSQKSDLEFAMRGRSSSSSLEPSSFPLFHVPSSFLGPFFCPTSAADPDGDAFERVKNRGDDFPSGGSSPAQGELSRGRFSVPTQVPDAVVDGRCGPQERGSRAKGSSDISSFLSFGGEATEDSAIVPEPAGDSVIAAEGMRHSGKESSTGDGARRDRRAKRKKPREISSKAFRSLQSQRVALISHGVFATAKPSLECRATVDSGNVATSKRGTAPLPGVQSDGSNVVDGVAKGTQARQPTLQSPPALLGFGARSHSTVDLTARDPRFSSLSGDYNESKFLKAYDFINTLRRREVSQLKEAVEKGRVSLPSCDRENLAGSGSGRRVLFDEDQLATTAVKVIKLDRQEREDAKRKLKSLQSQEVARRRLGQERAVRRRLAKDESERVAVTGKKPFFFSDSKVRRTAHLQTRGEKAIDGKAGKEGVDKRTTRLLRKRDKKLLEKERRRGNIPFPRRRSLEKGG